MVNINLSVYTFQVLVVNQTQHFLLISKSVVVSAIKFHWATKLRCRGLISLHRLQFKDSVIYVGSRGRMHADADALGFHGWCPAGDRKGDVPPRCPLNVTVFFWLVYYV